ncbi:DUF6048 family protein [Riemerella columbina]|uniref:DUF6048 family protein n=1 Tax=Riemerella columbina TaxID=103810 RepID=UPI0026709734|nr:DUF6048 family protein [Riemerella columbina]WKS96093.1 DUF6048 family protein [Riemerella columbina]
MKTKRLFTLFFSLALFGFYAAQQIDSTKAHWRYQPNFMVGIDVLGAGVSAFSEQKKVQFFISSTIKKRLNAVIEGGFAKLHYDKNAYLADAKGYFGKLGAFYMMSIDHENPKNGFYAGGKLAGSFYQQEYFSVPTKGAEGQVYSTAFPQSGQSSYWVEALLGGRVALFNTSFFIDVNVQPRYLFYTTKQDELFPMIVPGFGKSSTRFNMGVSWSLAYAF